MRGRRKGRKILRKSFTAFIILIFVILAIGACGTMAGKLSNSRKIELTQTDFEGKRQFEVYSILNEMGFKNIRSEAVYDISSKEEDLDGTIEKVTINDKEDYKNGDTFRADSEITLYYHVLEKVAIPVSNEDIINGINYENVEKVLEEAGFNNIKCEPIEDLTTDRIYEDGEVNGILINGEDFSQTNGYAAYDAEIIIKYHTLSPEINGKISITMDSGDFIGMAYKEAESLLRDMGFKNFEYEIIETNDMFETENVLTDIEITSTGIGVGNFSKEDIFNEDATVTFWYYLYEEPDRNLTINNCEDLAILLSTKDPESDIVKEFASKYYGDIIEFNGNIAYMANHGNYDTRYDMLIYAGDYSATSVSGPNFQFVDVGYYELGLSILDDITSYFQTGTNIYVIAEVKGYNDSTGILELEPVSVELR